MAGPNSRCLCPAFGVNVNVNASNFAPVSSFVRGRSHERGWNDRWYHVTGITNEMRLDFVIIYD